MNESETSDRRKDMYRTWLLAFARERVSTVYLLVVFCLVAVVGYLKFYALNLHTTTTKASDSDNSSSVLSNKIKRDGFMVLGMHRSGTSMLTGLLYMAGGYQYGGVLHKGQENTKGFFERFDAVKQNDWFLKEQKADWNNNVLAFDWERALKDKKSGAVEFNPGERFFRFINNPQSIPWLQKDPRMCITLKVWLKLMNKEPAIVYTYRHPLEVALSLQKRSARMNITRSLKLWIAYNMRAIQNSRGLCIVKTSNVALLADPVKELQRISDELTEKCGVAAPPHSVKQDEVDKFIDPTLQHQHAAEKAKKEVLESHNDGTCVAYAFDSKIMKGTRMFENEREAYLTAMRIYCDLESGKAYNEDYPWPDISEKQILVKSK